MPDPAESQQPGHAAAPAIDPDKLQRALRRAENTGGYGCNQKEVMLLAAAVRQYTPADVLEPKARELPSLTAAGPTCANCGTTVTDAGKLCDLCASKVAARPKPMFELGAQPEPAYARAQQAARDIINRGVAEDLGIEPSDGA